ncbi:MAG: SLBB domain-containing protein [Nitrospirae bacterium]|nr:SLBB domain-containing protein [Nitrospirota bacterium]
MRRLIALSIIVTFMFTGTYSIAGVANPPAAIGTAEDYNLSDYILGPGDKLDIKVYRSDELSYSQQIDSSGKITYPLLGDMQVTGMTAYTLRAAIAKGLSKYLKDPQVIITVTAYQSNNITIMGSVTNQGVLSIVRRPTIIEIISRAGGFSTNADRTNVLVIRKQPGGGSTVLNINVKKALLGDKTQDILLMKDDLVYVPTETNKVMVLGEVSTPGFIGLDKEMTDSPMSLLEVITRVGGFSTNADRTVVTVMRKEGERMESKKYNLKQLLEKGDISQNATVQKGDIVFVPKKEQKIIVMGEVSTTGAVAFDPPINIVELLARAGGLTSNANKNNVMIIRNDDEGKPQLTAVDIQKALESGDPTQNPELKNGDIVYVARDNKRIIVLGEVKSPGSFTYTVPITILDAISRAGGLASTANESKIVVVRQGILKIINVKDILKGDLAQNIVLQNEDIVYAPTTFIADVESVLGHINAIFSTLSTIASPMILWPQVKSAAEGKGTTSTISIPAGSSK